MNDTLPPDDGVLAAFGVQVVAPLGGRLNKHWLVEATGEHLVLRRWAQSIDSIHYEIRLVELIAARGWPVAPVVAGPIERAGYFWSLAPFLPGLPPSSDDPIAEQRARGRLLAEFHADLAQLPDLGQRAPWRRCEEILSDPTLDQILTANEQTQHEEVRLLRWHLDRARERIAGLALAGRPGIIVHGDFTTWNLRFDGGRLSGILDFELAHRNHRICDFAHSWRGKYDEVIYGYNEVSPLSLEEWALITPMWWAFLIELACQLMREGVQDDGWTLTKLLLRSPLMGPDATERP